MTYNQLVATEVSNAVTKAVNQVLNSFINHISEKFNLDKTQILEDWENGSGDKTKRVTKKIVQVDSEQLETDIYNCSEEDLMKLKRDDLQALCRKHGLKCSGTKAQLVSLLMEKSSAGDSDKPIRDGSAKKDSAKKEVSTKKVSEKQSTVKKQTAAEKKEVSKEPKIPVLKKLTEQSATIPIRRNRFGNFEHPETHLVFNKDTKCVIGKQLDDGTVADLTVEDIDTCKQYKMDYVIPKNLDKKTNFDDVKVEELDDEVEPDSDDEIIDEEELIADSEDEEDEIIEDDE